MEDFTFHFGNVISELIEAHEREISPWRSQLV